MELLLAEPKPEDGPGEACRRDPLHAEHLLVETRRLVEVDRLDRHMVQPRRSHPGSDLRREAMNSATGFVSIGVIGSAYGSATAFLVSRARRRGHVHEGGETSRDYAAVALPADPDARVRGRRCAARAAPARHPADAGGP